jgi:guanosine-3',5'-bis(diphosphate) 3'-pyrophosphohydrolase
MTNTESANSSQGDESDKRPDAVDAAFGQIVARLETVRPQDDLHVLRAAYEFAREKHHGQRRRSGDPYITHPVAVAQILASMEMDVQTLAAGLLHDVVEDSSVTIEELGRLFGSEIAALVDGVTKLTKAGMDEFSGHSPSLSPTQTPQDVARVKRQQEVIKSASNLRKIFLAMAKDLRVMVIKLADRLHNMRTLDTQDESRRLRIADETLRLYAPLAHRLGIWQIKWELEDLTFKYLEPEKYREIAAKVAQTRAERQEEVQEAIQILQERLREEGIDAQITGRSKHLYSIYQKMVKQGLSFEEILDLVALRVIVHTRNECYQALGIVNGLWAPIPGMFSDYIGRSKSNMYQSLHTKVIGPRAKPLEVQIRTYEMHRTAEFGIAAHWAYKEKGEGGKADDQFERKLSWLRQQLYDWQNDSRDSSEFLRSVTEDLFTDQVYVFTPKGDVIDLPAGATPIDFAYRIHSDVGNHAVGAKVNGRMVPLSYCFRNGDMVEIITRPNGAPSRDWLALAKTSHARSKIKAYFKRLTFAESVQHGREILERELERLNLDTRGLLKEEVLRAIAPLFNLPNEVELLAAVGRGTISTRTVINKLRPDQPLPPRGVVAARGKADDSKLRVSAGDVENVMFRRSRCCLPIPGDEVIGYITRGRGMALHRKECPNIRHYEMTERERLIQVDYAGSDNQVYSVNLLIQTVDRTGLIADVGNIFSETRTFISRINTQSHRDRTATLHVSAEVKDVDHLNRLFLAIRRLPDVLDISRAIGSRERQS